MRKLVIEFPCFGFGPASTSCVILAEILKYWNHDIVMISHGSALEYARREYPNISYIDVNTNHPENYKLIDNKVLEDAIVISNTNITFCKWCVNMGIPVVAVDTLFWLWEEPLDFIPNTEAYFVQDYFATNRIKNNTWMKYADKISIVGPIIENSNNTQCTNKLDQTLIAFGGMETPFSTTLLKEYCHKILANLFEYLENCSTPKTIHVVGGLITDEMIPNVQIYGDKRIIAHGSVSHNKFLAMLHSKYVFLTPGLTSIYEAIGTGICPYFLPGFSMSQILQADEFKSATDYNYIAIWNNQANLISELQHLPEEEGTHKVNQYIVNALCCNNGIQFPFIHEYLYNSKSTPVVPFDNILSTTEGIHKALRNVLQQWN